MDDFTKALKSELGLTLTNADKTGPPEYTDITQIDFLGRRFREEDGRFYAPRPWENLSLPFHWHKSQEPWSSVSKGYSECCFYELSHYDREEFKVRQDLIKKLFKDRGYHCAPTYSIDEYRKNLQKWVGSGRDMLLCWGL